MIVKDLAVEVTRRCNIQCDHCMRGEAQNLDIDLMCVERFFNEIDRIKKIIFTGGEPSLVPEILSDIIDIAKSKNVFLDFFEISTNAVSVSDTFIETILKIFDYCKDKKNTCIAVSLDDPHERASRYTHLNEIEKIENIDKLMALGFTTVRDEDIYYHSPDFSDPLYKEPLYEGRAIKSYPCRSQKKNRPHTVRVGKECEKDCIFSHIYLNCKGDLLSIGDISYETQDNEKGFYICNVMQKFSLLKDIKSYNSNVLLMPI